MNTLRAFIDRRRAAPEQGSVAVYLVLILAVITLIVGISIDSARKYHGEENAYNVAASAARAATSAVSADTVRRGGTNLNATLAQQTALSYIAAAGFEGTASVTGNTISVEVWSYVDTRFVSLIGVDALPIRGSANAQLITQ